MLTEKAKRFLAKNPTLIGSVAGHKFYEHPTLGDESPLVVINPDGEIDISDWWELPTTSELSDS